VVAGEFNAGKSSFINALLGKPGLLQEGVTPTTSQIYLLKYGEMTEQQPREKGIWVQTAPVELLKNINIVDTPGTNAILREHETLTSDFIPRSDLVLFLTSADRPFSESEHLFLGRIKEWGKKIVLIINKIDIFEDPAEQEKVVQFVRESAQTLVGDIAAVFPVSAKRAQKAKAGDPKLWPTSGFEPLETFIEHVLDDSGRFKLKLLNPLGVGSKLVRRQLEIVDADWKLLEKDNQLLMDIEEQMQFYHKDMERNFRARLSEIENILHTMEQRGAIFFDDTIRIGRIPDLIKREYLAREFEREVVGSTPQQIEARVSELVDWMVEQDLRQWTAVYDHLAQRRKEHDERIVGQTGPREGTLAYDRQRLVDSIGKTTQRTVESYDKVQEANRLADTAREAVAGIAAGGVGVGIGAALLLATTTAWIDVTGVITTILGVTLGMFVFPSRRTKAKNALSERLEVLRYDLITNLQSQFEREIRRGGQRIDDTVAPFSRFVRSERAKSETQRVQLIKLDEEIEGLKQQIEGLG
jgi:small GTP-binding protein